MGFLYAIYLYFRRIMWKSLFRFFSGGRGAPVQQTEASVKFLIVGLGNIGAEYHRTRHNIGFDVLDLLAERQEITFETVKLGDLAQFRHRGKQIFLLKPSTYMNRSGRALKYWMDKEKVPLSNVLVIVDDLHLDTGVIRIRTKGSDGGHNGLKDIQEQLGHNNYARIRFGIGRNFHPGQQVDYVLGKWSPEEWEQILPSIKKAGDACLDFVSAGAERIMNRYNG